MGDAISWALIVLAILAVQASEGPPDQPLPEAGPDAPGGILRRTLANPIASAASVARAIVVAGAALTVIVGLFSLAGVNGSDVPVDRHQQIVSGALQLAAGGVSLLLFHTGTQNIPGLRRLRPGAPISWLAIFLVFESIAANLGTITLSSGSTGSGAGPAPTLRPSTGFSARDLMLGEVPYLAVGIAAVGPVVRRNLVQTLERLGLWPLRLPWWVVGVAAGIVLVPVGSFVVDLLNHLGTASCIAANAQAEQAVVGVGRTSLEQVGVAIAAGVCEEMLFRGALQPRVGILISSVVWASYHLQYLCNGVPSPANLYLVLLGFAFGLLRKWGGLAPAILAHGVYDGLILLGLLGA